jgi:hypothetical protein
MFFFYLWSDLFFFRIDFTNTIEKINELAIYTARKKPIEENKQTILRLTQKNNPTVDQIVTISWLRDEAERLIREMTSEIKCQQIPALCDRTRTC